jgi:hypothetical protein
VLVARPATPVSLTLAGFVEFETEKLTPVRKPKFIRIRGEPANGEQDAPGTPVVEAQSVLESPGPGGQLMLNTRLGCAAKVRKVSAFANEGADKVKSALLMVTPSCCDRHPGEPSTPDAQPANFSTVPDETFEFPPPMAAESALKMTLLSDTVQFPDEPVSTVPVMFAEAFETKSKPPVRTATGANANRKLRNDICSFMQNIPPRKFKSPYYLSILDANVTPAFPMLV